MSALVEAAADAAVITRRNPIKIKRVPDLLVFTTLSPIMFVLLFAYAISWVMAVVGFVLRSPEVVNNARFIVIFPLTFVANTFVPSQSLPSALRVIRRVEPGLLGDPGGPAARRQHLPRAAGAGRVAHAAPGRLHADLGRDHPCRVLPVGGPSVPPGRQPLTVGPRTARFRPRTTRVSPRTARCRGPRP